MAEYYRDMGYDVAIMADSTSRWAEPCGNSQDALKKYRRRKGFRPIFLRGWRDFMNGQALWKHWPGVQFRLGDRAVSLRGDFRTGDPAYEALHPLFLGPRPGLANARHYPAISWLESYSEYVEEIEDWWAGVDPDWKKQRDQALEILQREDRLQQIVKLVGPDALPDNQRLVLLTAELLKNAFLQQNSFDTNDMYAVPERQVLMLRALLDFHVHAERVIKRGVPIGRVRECPLLDDLRRMKSTIPNEEARAIDGIRQAVIAALARLEGDFA